jgi:acetyltransferase
MNDPMTTAAQLHPVAGQMLMMGKRGLDAIFHPRSVAVIGASETAGAVGRTLLWNLVSSPFGGTVYPVNPKRDGVLGIKAYKTIADVPAKVDLAVIVTPAGTVPGIVKQCADVGVKAAIIISAGFKELGAPGVELEAQVLAEARRGRMRIVGPNCLGVMNPLNGLNATFAAGIAKPGNVAFISQSGALCTAILDWSFRERVGFSAFVSTGSMLDIGWGDLIDYLGDDPRTQSILIYMESIGDARAFLSAAREVALTKPIIVIKPGRTEQAAKAAASHTGSLAGSDDVLDAAFKRVGVLRVNTIADLFYMSELLAKQPRPRGNKLTIVTNAGGPGVLATDALVSNGGALTDLSKETYDQLNTFLPGPWSHNNPVDVLGDANAERYAKTLEACANDPHADGLLVILTPQDMTEPTPTAQLLTKYAKRDPSMSASMGKPIIASWMGGPAVRDGEDVLNAAGIPTFAYPDTAARMFCYMHRYSQNLQSIYETPSIDLELADQSRAAGSSEAAGLIIDRARGEGRTLLTEYESKLVLSAYHIPTIETRLVKTADEAVVASEGIGYPVVLKLDSRRITHKTDVGGVRLNLGSAQAVRDAFDGIRSKVQRIDAEAFDGVTVQRMARFTDAYELIVGSSPDAQFGPVLLFGAGGVLVEVFKDRALGLPPLNATLAQRMIEQTKISHALEGVRGLKPVDMDLLRNVLVRFSQLVVEQKWIREIDINPLLAGPEGVVALDARVVLYDSTVTAPQASVIRPYPSQYVSRWSAKDGTDLTLRPIRPEDEPLLVKFHETLSERTVRLRYFHPMKLTARTAHERLLRVCFNDYDREIAIVAERVDAKGERHIVGVGRLSKVPHQDEAEYAVLVSDAWQRKGIGSKLLERLVQIARDEKLARVTADILSDNHEMQAMSRKLGFKLKQDLDDGTVKAEIELR